MANGVRAVLIIRRDQLTISLHDREGFRVPDITGRPLANPMNRIRPTSGTPEIPFGNNAGYLRARQRKALFSGVGTVAERWGVEKEKGYRNRGLAEVYRARGNGSN